MTAETVPPAWMHEDHGRAVRLLVQGAVRGHRDRRRDGRREPQRVQAAQPPGRGPSRTPLMPPRGPTGTPIPASTSGCRTCRSPTAVRTWSCTDELHAGKGVPCLRSRRVRLGQSPCAVGFVLRLKWSTPGAAFVMLVAACVAIRSGHLRSTSLSRVVSAWSGDLLSCCGRRVTFAFRAATARIRRISS